MANILASQSADVRTQSADPASQQVIVRMRSDGEPIDPSPTINQAVNGGLAMAGNPLHATQDTERC
jgi:hypothetical protein